jgi:hypothetical protein
MDLNEFRTLRAAGVPLPRTVDTWVNHIRAEFDSNQKFMETKGCNYIPIVMLYQTPYQVIFSWLTDTLYDAYTYDGTQFQRFTWPSSLTLTLVNWLFYPLVNVELVFVPKNMSPIYTPFSNEDHATMLYNAFHAVKKYMASVGRIHCLISLYNSDPYYLLYDRLLKESYDIFLYKELDDPCSSSVFTRFGHYYIFPKGTTLEERKQSIYSSIINRDSSTSALSGVSSGVR